MFLRAYLNVVLYIEFSFLPKMRLSAKDFYISPSYTAKSPNYRKDSSMNENDAMFKIKRAFFFHKTFTF